MTICLDYFSTEAISKDYIQAQIVTQVGRGETVTLAESCNILQLSNTPIESQIR